MIPGDTKLDTALGDEKSCQNAELCPADARRAQVLDAAAHCFRRSGFHNASMSQISKTAGMSIGHIYHYFKNKEAIITALAERDCKEINDVLNEFHLQDDFLQALLNGIEGGIARACDVERSALKIEILAEAARNPAIAGLLESADRSAKEQFRCSLARALEQRDGRVPEDLEARAIMIGALFNGLAMRAVFTPKQQCEATTNTMRRAITAILAPDS